MSAVRADAVASRGGALIALGAGAGLFVTVESLPVGLLPQISSSLNSSLSATGLLVTLYAGLVFAASAPLTHLTRNLPRRVLLTAVLGVFVCGTLGSAAAHTYGEMLATRIVTAAAQAVFWSVAPVTAAGLVAPEARSRAVASVFAGSSAGIVLGVPGGTLLGQQAGWRVPFVVLAGLGLVAATAIRFLLPNARPSDSHAARGASPDRVRYRAILITTALTVGAFYTSYTFISAFLTRVAGLPHHAVPLILLASGIGSTFGLATSGLLYARRPAVAIAAPLAAMAASLLGLYAFGTAAGPAVAFTAIDSIALGTFIVAAQTSVLVCAPGRTDIATAWFSALFNAGIASGPIIGAIALGVGGLRSTALAGSLLAGAALASAVGLGAA